MEELYKALEDVIKCIVESKEYQNCILIQNKMKDNIELNNYINKVKEYQKKYIRSGYDKDIKKKLDLINNKLNEIPLYVVYLQNLEIVNQKIELVKDSLNDYFEKLFNG